MKYIAPKSKDTQAQIQQLFDAINGLMSQNTSLRTGTPGNLKGSSDSGGSSLPTGSTVSIGGMPFPLSLNADMVDGLHASAFSQTDHTHIITDIGVGAVADDSIIVTHDGQIYGEPISDYATSTHNHDADYSDIAHNHDGEYGRWRGESAIPPEDALSNDVYYNTSNGGTYVYIGFISTWLLIPTDYATAGHNHDTTYHPLGSYCAWLGYLSSEPTGVDGAIYVNDVSGYGYLYVNAAWTRIF